MSNITLSKLEELLTPLVQKAVSEAMAKQIPAKRSANAELLNFLTKDKTSEKSERKVHVEIEGHPTRKTWTKKMKLANDKAYKAGLEAGDDYLTRLTAGLEAAKAVA